MREFSWVCNRNSCAETQSILFGEGFIATGFCDSRGRSEQREERSARPRAENLTTDVAMLLNAFERLVFPRDVA